MISPLHIAGHGWISGLGRGAAAYAHFLTGLPPHREALGDSLRHKFEKCTPAPGWDADIRKQPRLRRSSRISHFACLAALDACEMAGISPSVPAMAVVMTVSSGGVNYTRRFFHGVLTDGPAAASPLLFPETVYNAPASHIASLLGIDAPAYTLTGDGAVGFAGIELASDLLATGEAERVLLIGAEECDPVLCEGYAAWGCLHDAQSTELVGMPGEGAAAVVLESGAVGLEIAALSRGKTFQNRAEAILASAAVRDEISLSHPTDRVVAESTWGECLGASVLLRLVLGCHELSVPGTALLEACGWSFEAGAAVLRRRV